MAFRVIDLPLLRDSEVVAGLYSQRKCYQIDCQRTSRCFVCRDIFSPPNLWHTHFLIMSTFYRLPVELLTIITQCVNEEKEWFKEGKALHLTHPHFANLDYLNTHLFHNINFHATPEGIDRLKSRSWTAIESRIRKITFLPSEYSTDITFFHYRNIVMEQCDYYWTIERNLTDHPKRCGPESKTDLDSGRRNVPPYAPGELFASFREYRR